MSVKSCTELVDQMKLQYLFAPGCHIPDHNVLSLEVEISGTIREELLDKNLGSKQVHRKQILRRFGDNYMNSEVANRLLPELIADMEKRDSEQETGNKIYKELCDLLLSEAEKSVNKNRKRKHTKRKPYWDLELSKKWREMKTAEKSYRISCKEHQIKKSILEKKTEFRRAQKEFDGTLKRKKRAFCKGIMTKIESFTVNNPEHFWEYVNNLGPRQKGCIPWEVRIDGKLEFEHAKVLEKWKMI